MSIGSAEFQKKLLSVLSRNKLFCLKTIPLIKESYFTREDIKSSFSLISSFVKEYKSVPSKDTCLDYAVRNGADKYLLSFIGGVYDDEVSDFEYIMVNAVNFIKVQEWKSLQIEMDDLIKNNMLDEVQRRAMEISNIGVGKGKDDYDYLGLMDDRFTRDMEKSRTVGTGISGIDEFLDRGGLGEGELGLIAAPPNSGKSTMLVTLGKNCLLSGHNVYHFTEELSDRKTARRYDQCILGVTKDEIYRLPRRSRNRLKEILDEIKSRLIIREHPSKSTTVSVLDEEIDMMANKYGMSPDLIIVDYADLMLPSRKYEDRRFELEDIYMNLRGLAQKKVSRVWTASQSGTETLKGVRHIGMEHLSESIIGKAAIVDVMISINQTIEQKKLRRGSLFIAKNRDDERDVSVPVYVDWSRMVIRNISSE